MEADFLARRPVGTGWFGDPRVKWYKRSYNWITGLSQGRFACGFTLLLSLDKFHSSQSHRISFIIVTLVSMAVAAVDWIPYHTHVWSRHPTAIHRWSTPAAGACGLAVSILVLFFSLQTEDGEFGWCQWIALVLFLMSLIEAILSTSGLVYFVYDKPLRLPSRYEPITEDTGTGGNTSSDSDSEMSHFQDVVDVGQLARIFTRQQTRRREEPTEQRRTNDRSGTLSQRPSRATPSARPVQVRTSY